MSELIDNRKKRQEKLKALILRLHDGEDFESVKEEFQKEFGHVAASEISAMEQSLVADGMPVRDIQRLCDVHSSVFKGSIEQIHAQTLPQEPRHPAAFLRAENRALENHLENAVEPARKEFLQNPDAATRDALSSALQTLDAIDRHYSKKENLLFSFLEKHDITAPPKVMWGVDDENRQRLKDARRAAEGWPDNQEQPQAIHAAVELLDNQIREMIFKEENILLPMALEALLESEWQQIAVDSREIGFCLIESPPVWPQDKTTTAANEMASDPSDNSKQIPFPSGHLRPDELRHMLNALPFDLTFVGADDKVRYFTQGKDRIFERSPSIIGRAVVNCHPPASMHVVEQILADFKSGKREQADFWIRMGNRYVLIRYYAIRDDQGAYAGTLEVTQDIEPLQKIEGEKRLLDEPT